MSRPKTTSTKSGRGARKKPASSTALPERRVAKATTGNAPARARTAQRKAPPAKWVYLLGEGDARMKALLGGKGANLAEMTKLGLPVPPGFVLTTEACNAYLAADGFAKGMWEQTEGALAKIERMTGKRFGDPARPLLVSCRSGARFSMPGMMDTVLNIGLNDEVVVAVADATGDARFAYDAYRRLVQRFGTVVCRIPDEPFQEVLAKYRVIRRVTNDADLGVADLTAITAEFKSIVRTQTGHEFPTEPMAQLRRAVEAVSRSWNGKRAIDYRNAAAIPHDLGTAVNIVTMVFGNMGADSATGVVTTRDVTTGERELEGDWLANAQGEDVAEGAILEAEAKAVMKERGMKVHYEFGTMIEMPRAALTAGDIARSASFFSFGTNDLTQTTFGISRDDAETGFLQEYLEKRILPENPFATIDQGGVGKLMAMAVEDGRATRPGLQVGICGEHGGDPKTIAFCHQLGLDYVGCSSYRVPIARLAAAHAALALS